MKKHNGLQIIPFGGCGEFGMNLTAYIYDQKLFIVDAGVLFPEPRRLGISSIIPDIEFFKKQFKSVFAYIITHGHEDHIGALPYFYKALPAPIYATPWTKELIKNKFYQHRISENAEINTVRSGDHAKFDGIGFEYFHVNHSIPDACSLIVRTKNETVFHTGDFRFDKTPSDNKPVNFDYLKRLGKEGVNLLLADSTNAMSEGDCASEKSVLKPLDKLIKNASGRVFVTTFASNFWRLRTVYEICQKRNKKLFLAGRSIDKTFDIARKLEMFEHSPGVIISEKELSSTPKEDVVVLCTGSQGEWRSALARVASGEHRNFKIDENDLVIFSSREIPGNEKSILNIVSQFEKLGAKVITTRRHPEIHTSGHAYRNELNRLVSLLKPSVYLPVHGSFSHLISNQNIAPNLLVKKDDGIPVSNGDVLKVNGDEVKIDGHFDVEKIFVESDSYITIRNEQLRDRLRIGELGLAVVTGIISKKSREFKKGPFFSFHGISFPEKTPESNWCQGAKSAANRALEKNENDSQLGIEEINEDVRVVIRRSLSQVLNRKPVVICKFIYN